MKLKGKGILFVLVTIIIFSACDAVDDLLTFTISDRTTFQVESTAPFNLPFEMSTPDVTTNSSEKFENNDTRADLVKDIKLKELKLSITAPADKTFSFLKSVHFYISAGENDEIELAYLDEIPTTATEIALIPTTEKLDAYVKASSYKLRTKIVTRETLSEAVDIQADLAFKVTASPL
jgi:hypothetical protein